MKLILLHLKKNKKLIILLKLFPNTISKKKKKLFSKHKGHFEKLKLRLEKLKLTLPQL